MARRRSQELTDGELRIMRALWDRGRATVGAVVERVEGSPRPAYNTVLTVLRILETKGYVRHEKDGRAFVYAPLIDRAAARRSALSHLVRRFFDGSTEALVLDLLGHDSLQPEEVEQLRRLVAERNSEHPGRGRRA
jgi:predicted transcriptional regulator